MNQSQYDIVLFTLFRTDHPYSSVSLSWAREFAKNNRVFYINHPYSLKDIAENLNDKKLKERLPSLLRMQSRYETVQEIQQNFIAIQPPATLPINWLPKGVLYKAFYTLNNRIVLRTLKKVVKDFDLKNYIFLNCYNPYFLGHLPKKYGPYCSVYQSIDDISQDPYSAKHGQGLERQAVAKSDFALVTSTRLQKLLKPYNPDTYVINNAVDISIFEKTLQGDFQKPKAIEHVKTPIIGFTGNMDALRIDYSLLRQIALAHPDKTLLLVGPVNSREFYTQGLDNLPNVIATGAKKITELPRYLYFMDVVLIPFLCNTLTASIYPLKINEYLAAGRPVISTIFSKDIQEFSAYIYLAPNKKSFIKLIDTAIRENNPMAARQRLEVARKNTWAARIEQFWKLFEKVTTAASQKPQAHALPKFKL